MEVVNPICCGIDVHKASLTACLRSVGKDGRVGKKTREFRTFYDELLSLADWLVENDCPVAAMESTGVYWKPVYNALAGVLEVLVGNAQQMKRGRGKKTDKSDAEWISELLAHGLISPSFVPGPRISALRALNRTRANLVNTRTQAKNRVHKVLEDGNIKLSSVATDIFGKSGRAMLDALVSGERDPEVLSGLALRSLRRKIPQLKLALRGRFTEHHAMLIRQSLEMLDLLNRQMSEIEAEIRSLMQDLDDPVEHLTSIPGLDLKAARVIISEIGVDMSRFGSAARLASWSGLCPGNNESAGKRLSGRTRKGNKYLKRVLVECAWSVRRSDNFLGATFRRLQSRMGGKKAAVAVAHKMLVISYHLLDEGEYYDEQRYDRIHPRQEARYYKNAIATLERLGYEVSLKQAV